jgi:hypothetical protein
MLTSPRQTLVSSLGVDRWLLAALQGSALTPRPASEIFDASAEGRQIAQEPIRLGGRTVSLSQRDPRGCSAACALTPEPGSPFVRPPQLRSPKGATESHRPSRFEGERTEATVSRGPPPSAIRP